MSTVGTAVAGYMLAYSDDMYEGPSILPSVEAMPRVLYRTIEAAEAALETWKLKIDNFLPVLYGEVYPYDKTTARQQIEKKGHAVYGWAIDDNGGESVRHGIFILQISFFEKSLAKN